MCARYEGGWLGGLPHGQGKWSTANGARVYEGGFERGLRHGPRGAFTFGRVAAGLAVDWGAHRLRHGEPMVALLASGGGGGGGGGGGQGWRDSESDEDEDDEEEAGDPRCGGSGEEEGACGGGRVVVVSWRCGDRFVGAWDAVLGRPADSGRCSSRDQRGGRGGGPGGDGRSGGAASSMTWAALPPRQPLRGCSYTGAWRGGAAVGPVVVAEAR